MGNSASNAIDTITAPIDSIGSAINPLPIAQNLGVGSVLNNVPVVGSNLSSVLDTATNSSSSASAGGVAQVGKDAIGTAKDTVTSIPNEVSSALTNFSSGISGQITNTAGLGLVRSLLLTFPYKQLDNFTYKKEIYKEKGKMKKW